MKIQIIITDDNDKELINESVNNIQEARFLLQGFEYECDARADNETVGE